MCGRIKGELQRNKSPHHRFVTRPHTRRRQTHKALFKILNPVPNLDWSINRPQPSAGIDAIIPMISGPFHSRTWRDFQNNISPDRLVYLMLSEEDLRSNTPPGGFGISKLVRSRSSILRRGQPAFLFTDQHQLQHPSFSCLHTSLTSLTTPPPTTQLSPNSFSRLQIFSLGGVVLSWRVHPWPGCRTLAGTVAGRQGVTVRSRAGHRGRRAGTGTSPESRHATALVATLVTQGRGQWGSHWRRHGQRRRLWRLRQHHQLGTLLLLLCWTSPWLLASVTSVYGGATHPTVAPPAHPTTTRSSGEGEVAQITQF